MSIGPQMPPHLRQSNESDEDEDQSFGPKLPSVACKGPKPTEDSESESDDDQSYGPKLPSVPCKGPKPTSDSQTSIGPQVPGPSAKQNIGPQLPPGLGSSKDSQSNSLNSPSSESDDDMIGPRPPKPGEEISQEEMIARNIEARAQKMKDKIEGRDKPIEPKRESWMLELPKSRIKDFGLGPRSFSQSTKSKTKQDKTWTQTPQDRLKGEQNDEQEEANDHSQDEDVLAYMASLERDKQMDEVSNELKKKRGTDSLMEIHDKKMKKKKKKDKKSKGEKPEERRPFDRDQDLQVNRFDEAQKKAMLKKAAKLDSRFSSGGSKYL